MQRPKAAVSLEVKRVVGALCRLLAAVGLEAVPQPEAFRRAKFGARSEEDQFWQLLTDIIQTSGIVSSKTRTRLTADRRKLVAAGLWQTGYHADWLYRGGGESFSSRDLLLALGWLLAAGTLEKLVTHRVQQLDRTLLSPVPMKCEFSGGLELDTASLRRLQWLIGRLRHQGRILLSMMRVRTRALHDVFSASKSSSSSSSGGQSFAVLQEDSCRLQQLCDLLESYVSWKQVESIFWTWMDSVVDQTDPPDIQSSQPPNGNPAVCCHGDQRLEKLEEMLLNLPSTQEAQRRQTGSDESASPLLSCLPSLTSIPDVCRVQLQAEGPTRHPKEPHSRSDGLQSRSEAPDELQASQAAELLLHNESLLLLRRDGRRRANRTLLQEAMGCLEELVLIPL